MDKPFFGQYVPSSHLIGIVVFDGQYDPAGHSTLVPSLQNKPGGQLSGLFIDSLSQYSP